MATLIEQSEREVIEKAKAWQAEGWDHSLTAEEDLEAAIGLLVEREAAELALDTGTVPQPRHARTVEHEPGQAPVGAAFCVDHKDSHTTCGIAVYEREQKAIAENVASSEVPRIDSMPEPRPGAAPLARPPKKLSRREQEIEKRRQSDRTGRDRDDIDYSSIEDPSAR